MDLTTPPSSVNRVPRPWERSNPLPLVLFRSPDPRFPPGPVSPSRATPGPVTGAQLPAWIPECRCYISWRCRISRLLTRELRPCPSRGYPRIPRDFRWGLELAVRIGFPRNPDGAATELGLTGFSAGVHNWGRVVLSWYANELQYLHHRIRDAQAPGHPEKGGYSGAEPH